jgi:hypothetical protein
MSVAKAAVTYSEHVLVYNDRVPALQHSDQSVTVTEGSLCDSEQVVIASPCLLGNWQLVHSNKYARCYTMQANWLGFCCGSRLGANPTGTPLAQLVNHIVAFANRSEGQQYTHCRPDLPGRGDYIPSGHTCIDPASEVPAGGGKSACL